MKLIAEAIEKINELAESRKPERLATFPNEDVYAVPTPEGGWTTLSIARQPARPTLRLNAVEDAVAFAEFAADPKTALWILGGKSVGLLFNRADDKSGSVSVPFQVSEAWAYLREPKWMAHREFVAFARRSMPFLPTPFMAVVRNLRIEKSDATDSEATAVSAAMAKRFTVKASGAGDLPETVCASFKPFFNVAFPASVNCVFEIDFDNAKIRLAPIDGEIEGNLAAVHEHIREEIGQANKDWLVVSGTAS